MSDQQSPEPMTFMVDSHERKISTAHAAMWAAYGSGNRDDAYHYWGQVVRLISARSPIVIAQMERRMGLLPASNPRDDFDPFYSSQEWRAVRYRALKKHGARCQCCGGRGAGVVLHVDHIKPRSKHPDLELDVDNCQILCDACNLGKSNKDDTDWRR